MRRRLTVAAVATIAIGAFGCPGKPSPVARAPVAPPHDDSAARAAGLVRAASAMGNVEHTFVIDPMSRFAAGRGMERVGDGSFRAIPTACAVPRERAPGANVDADRIDFAFVGVAVDDVLVGADVDLGAYFGAGASHDVRTVSLAAVAFVRDLDPQFFDASDAVSAGGGGCTCGRATHFIGATKLGGMLAYDLEVRADEAHGKALDLFRTHLAKSDARLTERRIGGLEIDGLDRALAGGAPGALRLRVTSPAPIAYAVHPIDDVCNLAFPEPEVTPAPVDFGDAPYGAEAKRLLHVVNRATFDVQAAYAGSIFEIPARATLDIEARWRPEGEVDACDPQLREESILFAPLDARAEVTPRQRSVRVVERVRTGKPRLTRDVHVDTGASRAPDYASTARDIACPPDYVVAACRVTRAECEGAACDTNGYAISATESATGCRFACSGPTSMLPLASHSCRYDAVAECRLRCP